MIPLRRLFTRLHRTLRWRRHLLASLTFRPEDIWFAPED